MTNQPREFWISICTFNDGYTEIYETRTAEFEPCPPAEKIHVIEAAPVLEKIARLEKALEKCRAQRDDYLFNLHEVAPNFFNYALAKEEDEEELESTLEGK